MKVIDRNQTTLLHVVERLSSGGAGRSLVALARELAKRGGFTQRVLSLLEAEPAMRESLRAEGISVVGGEGEAAWRRECDNADLVQIYLWNSPVLNDFLHRDLPAMRCIVWLQVNCAFPPHAVIPIVNDRAVALIASCALPPCGARSVDGVIPGACDLARLEDHPPSCHADFTVGYIGTIDPVKMHPLFVSMSAAANLPGGRFVIFGGGGALRRLAGEAAQRGASDRFLFRGYTENVGEALRQFDVFGYPLCEDNYSTSELVLQEALYVGVPPVVFAHGGAATVVRNNETGLIVRSPREYTEALEFLFHHPEERARLGRAGRKFARSHFGAARVAEQFTALYQRVMAMAKSHPSPESVQRWYCRERSGAQRFIDSLTAGCPFFEVSLISRDDGAVKAADEAIASVSPVVAAPSGGGVMDYARYYRDDPHLALWSGLILERQGRYALALGEYRRAQKLGLNEPRVIGYLERTARRVALPSSGALSAHEVV